MFVYKEPDQIKVMVVDDQEMIRDLVGLILSRDPVMNLVGEFGDAESALAEFDSLDPDVVIMDVRLPGINGIEAAQLIRATDPEVGIIVFSSYSDPAYIREFIGNDPRGKSYLLKNTLSRIDELVRTIYDVAGGRTVLDPSVVGQLTSPDMSAEDRELRALTHREREVLSLMAEAQTNRAIAQLLYIEPRTVEHHINSIYNKLCPNFDESRHSRVQVVLSYLNATHRTQREAVLV